MTQVELDHIKKIYDRIDKIKDDLIDFSTQIGNLKESIKDNKIDDLINDKELEKQIRSMSAKQGRKTTFKWGAGLLAAIEAIRQILENL